MRINTAKQTSLNQISKQTLGQVLGIGGGMLQTPKEGVKRIPVLLAQRGERSFGLGGAALACLQNDAPVGGGETRWRLRRNLSVWVSAVLSHALNPIQLW